MRWLDPKLDVVFKLLFAHEKNRDILIALLTAVLKPSGLTQRFLHYWARLHASQLSRGDHYEKLCPTLSVLILARPLLPLAKAHSKLSNWSPTCWELRLMRRGQPLCRALTSMA